MAKVLTNRPAAPQPVAQPMTQQAPVVAPQPVAAAAPAVAPQPQPMATNAVAVQPAAVQPMPAQSVVLLDARPQFLTDYKGDTGTAAIAQFVQPPRIKIVQKMSDMKLRERFPDGTLLIMPGEAQLGAGMADAKEGYAVPFIPVFFYPEYYALNDFKTKGTLPYVRERSLDPKSDVAKKCRIPKYQETCPEFPEYPVKFAQALNYVIVPIIDGVPGEACILSFWKGDIKSGQAFGGLILQRGSKFALWGNQFELYSIWRPGSGKGDYFGINVQNPESVGPFVESGELFEQLTQRHEAIAEAHSLGLLEVDLEDSELGNGDGNIPY